MLERIFDIFGTFSIELFIYFFTFFTYVFWFLYNCSVLVTFSKHISIHALWELIWSFSETWLDEQMTNGLLDPKNRFHVYRCDRGDIHFEGGVCIFVENF